MMADLYPVSIQGSVELSDGSKTEFSIQPNLGWQQWGNTTEKLFVTTPLMDDLVTATADHLSDNDEDGE